MKTEALFLFLILLLGLFLCSFLGVKYTNEGFTGNFSGTFATDQSTNMKTTNQNNSQNKTGTNYDNYNHYSGTSTQLQSGTKFTGPNGGSVTVNTNSDGTQSLQIVLENGQQPMTFTTQDLSNNSTSTTTTESYTNYYGANGTATQFYGPNGSTATVVNANNGNKAINVQTSSGSYTFTESGAYYNPNNTSSTQYYGSTGYPVQSSSYTLAYEGVNGASAGAVTGPAGNTAYYAQGPAGNTVAGVDTNPYYNSASATQYYGPYGGSAGAVTGPAGNTAYYAKGPAGTTVAGTTSNNGYGNQYSTSLPAGIPASLIPPGQEDLYILKSEIVPPVCPACPTSSACPRQEPCPPCPACARCPEPAFDCKKVPNYNAINNEYLPTPVLNDFSKFGM
jgi:hypothetical protein